MFNQSKQTNRIMTRGKVILVDDVSMSTRSHPRLPLVRQKWQFQLSNERVLGDMWPPLGMPRGCCDIVDGISILTLNDSWV